MDKESNDKFVSWVSEKIPYCGDLEKDELGKLSELYQAVERNSEIERRTLANGLNSKSGVDYANDFEKASRVRVSSQQALSDYITRLDESHDYDRSQVTEEGKHY